jgi:hypothetical protein
MKTRFNFLLIFLLIGSDLAAEEWDSHVQQINEGNRHIAICKTLKVGESWSSSDGEVEILLLELNKSISAKFRIRGSKNQKPHTRQIKVGDVPAELLDKAMLVEIQENHIVIELHTARETKP